MDPNAVPMPPMPEPPAPPPENAIVGQPANAPAARPAVDKEKARQDLVFNGILMAVGVIVIGVIFGVLKYWARRQTEDCENPTMTLSSYREMYENGELSQEEYEQIRTKMAAKMKGSLGIKPLPAIKPQGERDVGRNGTPPAPENPT